MGLKVRRRKGTRNWQLRGTVRGRYVEETTGTSDKATAEAIRIQREAEILERSVFGERASQTFIEAAAAYLANAGDERFLGRYDPNTVRWSGLIGHFGERRLQTIDQHDLDAAADALLPDAAPATRNRQVYTPFIAIWNHAGMPPTRWRRPKGAAHVPPPRFANPAYVAALLDALGDQPRLYALVVFLVYTGRRIGDATALDWREVDLEARTVVIARTKSGSPAAVHLPETALAALANLPKREGKVFGFASRWSVYKPLRAACEAAGIEYLPPHILGRHTFATWMRRYAGADLNRHFPDGPQIYCDDTLIAPPLE